MARRPDSQEDEETPSPITDEEMETIMDGLRGKKRAPGPNGVHGNCLTCACGADSSRGCEKKTGWLVSGLCVVGQANGAAKRGGKGVEENCGFSPR